MNIELRTIPSELVYQACSKGKYDELVSLIETGNYDLNQCQIGKECLLKTTRGFIDSVENTVTSPN